MLEGSHCGRLYFWTEGPGMNGPESINQMTSCCQKGTVLNIRTNRLVTFPVTGIFYFFILT